MDGSSRAELRTRVVLIGGSRRASIVDERLPRVTCAGCAAKRPGYIGTHTRTWSVLETQAHEPVLAVRASQSAFEMQIGVQNVCDEAPLPVVVQVVGLFAPPIVSLQHGSSIARQSENAPMVQTAAGHHCRIAQRLPDIVVPTQHELAQPDPVVQGAEHTVPSPGIVTHAPAPDDAVQHTLPGTHASPIGMHDGGTTQRPSVVHGCPAGHVPQLIPHIVSFPHTRPAQSGTQIVGRQVPSISVHIIPAGHVPHDPPAPSAPQTRPAHRTASHVPSALHI